MFEHVPADHTAQPRGNAILTVPHSPFLAHAGNILRLADLHDEFRASSERMPGFGEFLLCACRAQKGTQVLSNCRIWRL